MTNPVFRRAQTTFWEDTAHILFVGALILAILLASRAGIQSGFRWIWIDLQSVTVPDHDVSADPDVTAHRRLHQSFWGSWTVEVRRAEDHRFICSTPGPRIWYDERAGQINPLVMPMSEWVLDGAAIDSCQARGFGSGRFYLTTCHRVAPLGLAFKRCVDSNVFVRTAGDPDDA